MLVFAYSYQVAFGIALLSVNSQLTEEYKLTVSRGQIPLFPYLLAKLTINKSSLAKKRARELFVV
ncbi:hypothetical protein WKK05_35840 [Nostoc sp. UHCC 0302]|uniref:hypothetical protein n=1 Tax=Nostoc sp. UHCC 0302 TaxID=3134896 RepID=UPI00311C96CD